MLPLLETFLDVLLWISFQCRRHIFLDVPEVFVPFKLDFISGNRRKSFGVITGEQGGVPFQ